jgi:hypothetical protein
MVNIERERNGKRQYESGRTKGPRPVRSGRQERPAEWPREGPGRSSERTTRRGPAGRPVRESRFKGRG